MKKKYSNLLGLILCGISIGWMIGISVSPVIQGILTTIFSFVVLVLGVVSGIKGVENSILLSNIKNINLLPIGFFFLFLSMGAASGIYTRTNDYLGLNPKQYYEKWKQFDSIIIDSTSHKLDSLNEGDSKTIKKNGISKNSSIIEKMIRKKDEAVLYNTKIKNTDIKIK